MIKIKNKIENEIKFGEKNKAIRKIFEGQIQFDDYQNQQLEFLKQHIKDEKYQLIYQQKIKVKYQNYNIIKSWNNNILLRFLYANQFKIEKTFKTIKQHQEWRQQTLPVQFNDNIKDFLVIQFYQNNNKKQKNIKFKQSFLYIQKLNIIIKQKIKKEIQNLLLHSITYFFEYILKYIMLPGQIENWVVLLDLNSIGISSLPISALKTIIRYLSINYRSRMFATYVINTPSSIFIPWNIIKGFLDENIIKKIKIFKRQLRQIIIQTYKFGIN
ncbi:hypothetical protein IMG5_156970 [Ichthyophthirius multifiliis]|uniref:CRAL-TRIO domain-containing protein n=1 Tax=Ichthyophthirius multifiliis TaxID=5932 RepID=G0QZI1_ICHMU|nr:hypothetical protein IMG5_156970 [Ichthyophthirius multifiliis]EGR29370.1 hypothetical protein IMG5_156970 [Ichthyophthirius multifiliis]|eukprot:XP_004030606.1 hypothetical protein IMG5_156970 [Ichthyophthirius multifiliis]